MSDVRPVKLLIAAMGGEGGGVLMDWIVNAAWRLDYPVQATSVPGVAQRTGATTYYIELLPETRAPGSKRPIFALTPIQGEVDLMVSTELAEAARAVSQGFVTAERTTLIASTHRVYATDEKIALGDGRLDDAQLRAIVDKAAQQAILFDAAEAARRTGTVINAVMLGAIAATGILNIPPEEFTRAIEEEGKAVKPNLAGFRLGYAIAKGEEAGPTVTHAKRPDPLVPTEALDVRIAAEFPEAAQANLRHGVRRLADYQDIAYAQLYLERMAPFAAGDAALCKEVARHLAVRMSYEDIVRVAQAKIREARYARIREEARAEAGDLVEVTEFFKPGIPEFTDMMPPALARPVIRWAERAGRLHKSGWAMHVRSTTVTGFLKIWALSKLRPWRRRSYRYAEESRQIEDWLALVQAAAAKDTAFAHEVCDLARLIKGYGSTHRRGSGNYKKIVDALVTPELARPGIGPKAAERVRVAREAALKDPDGKALAPLLAVGAGGPDLAHAAE